MGGEYKAFEKDVLENRRNMEIGAHKLGCGTYAAIWGIHVFFAMMSGGDEIITSIAIISATAISICVSKANEKDREKYGNEFDSHVSTKNQFIADTIQTQNEFIVSREIREACGEFAIVVDDQNKKWIIILPSQEVFYLYRFDDLIGYAISKDGKSVVSGNVSEAVIGGVLFGTSGAVAGASASKTVQETCSALFLDITVNDPQAPALRINLLPNGEKSTENERKYAFSIAREIAAQMAYIKANSNAPAEGLDEHPASDRYAELERLFSLKEKGVITEKEYTQKKQELLNL